MDLDKVVRLADNGIQWYVIELGKRDDRDKIEKVFYSEDKANQYIKRKNR